jgi:hypothetical protein
MPSEGSKSTVLLTNAKDIYFSDNQYNQMLIFALSFFKAELEYSIEPAL